MGGNPARGTVWTYPNLKQVQTVRMGDTVGRPVLSQFMPPDGNRFLILSDTAARIWRLDAPSEAPIEFIAHEDRISAGALSPDGTWIAAGGADGKLLVWSSREPSRRPISISAHGDKVLSLQFSSDGRRLLSASVDGTAQIWHIGDAERLMDDLWQRTTHCLSVAERQSRLGETIAVARERRHSCRAKVRAIHGP